MIKFKKPRLGSLKLGIIMAIILGILLAIPVYVLTFDISEYIRVNYYATEQARIERERQLAEEFQRYVVDHEVSADDTDSIRRFVRQKKYIYLLLNDGGNVYFFSGLYGDSTRDSISYDIMPGVAVEYPTEEEMKAYALTNGFVSVEMADGSAFLSIADFSEYFYMDFTRALTIVLSMFTMALVIFIYFFRVTNRITRLASEVNLVADGDMSHSIHIKGRDEISKLSSDVENMRTVILQTLESERRARAANTELVTSMSHDIRTPLTVLLGYIDVMKMHPHDETMGDYIKATEATALRLKKLSDDMFGYFLVFGDKAIEANIQDYDGSTLLSQMLDEHVLLLRENGYTVSYEEGSGLEGVSIMTDAPKAMRLIDNIFSNLHKYSDPERPITVGVSMESERALLTVENGIAKDTRTAESNGIGLKTCVKLAELLDIGFEYERQKDCFRCVIAFPTEREN